MKKEIFVTDKFKMYRLDPMNIILEEYVEQYSPRHKKTTKSWKFLAYVRTYQKGLEYLIKYDKLIDYDEIDTIEDYLEQIQFEREIIQNLIEKF